LEKFRVCQFATFGGGVPAGLTLPIVQGWRVSCDGLATSLDGIMRAELLRIMGVAPW